MGWQQILTGYLALVRQENAKGGPSRKRLAEYVGVAPALVTYYFPTRDALVEAATIPILEDYLDAIAQSRALDDAFERLRAVLRLLLRLFSEDRGVLEAYAACVEARQKASGANLIKRLECELRHILCDLSGERGDEHLTMVHHAVLGTCQGAAQLLSAHSADEGDANPDAFWALDALAHGLCELLAPSLVGAEARLCSVTTLQSLAPPLDLVSDASPALGRK